MLTVFRKRGFVVDRCKPEWLELMLARAFIFRMMLPIRTGRLLAANLRALSQWADNAAHRLEIRILEKELGI